MKKDNILSGIMAALLMWAVLYIFNATAGGEGAWGQLSSLNPAETVNSMTFMMSFGFGMPEWASWFVSLLFLAILYWAFYRFVLAVIRSYF